ncbi:MAG: hypothetical protein Q7K42_05715 [Candidatus Diapherotrites archaeon]|nr:hypothetical protein [Candidatus Diapherotrites archaeon]
MRLNFLFAFCFLFFLTIFTLPVFADFDYQISQIPGAKDLNIVMQFDLQSENAVNAWNVEIPIPENSKVLSVQDSKGKVSDFSVKDGFLNFKTNSGKARNSEKVKVFLLALNAVDDSFAPLYFADLALPGFEDRNTFVQANFEDTLSASPSLGFSTEYFEGQKGAGFSGLGPMNLRLLFGKPLKKYKNFVVFGTDNDLSMVDSLVPLVEEYIGMKKPFPYFSIVMLKDQDFNSGVNEFSAASYESAGLIKIRESMFQEPYYVATLIHEITHGFTEQVLKWTPKADWFNEGVSTYVEFATNFALGERQEEVFGNDVTFIEGPKKITLRSQSSAEELWNYYKNGESFMGAWSPGTSDKQKRDFGYAFSSLQIRQVYSNDSEKLKTAYAGLAKIRQRVESQEEANTILLDFLGLDVLKPCYSSSKELLENCIRKMNDLEPEIPASIQSILPKKEVPTPIDTNLEFPEEQVKDAIQDAINSGSNILDSMDKNLNTLPGETETKKSILDILLEFIRDLFNEFFGQPAKAN